MSVLFFIFLALATRVHGLSASTLRPSVKLPKEVAVENLLRRKLDTVPQEQFRQAVRCMFLFAVLGIQTKCHRPRSSRTKSRSRDEEGQSTKPLSIGLSGQFSNP